MEVRQRVAMSYMYLAVSNELLYRNFAGMHQCSNNGVNRCWYPDDWLRLCLYGWMYRQAACPRYKCDLFIDIFLQKLFADSTFFFLDLNYLEECSDSPELTVAILPRTGKVNLMSMESRLHVDMLESVASLATQGCEQIHTILDAVVRENTQQLKDSMLQWSFLLIKQSTLNFILATSSFTLL